jgi:hypothetical protein
MFTLRNESDPRTRYEEAALVTGAEQAALAGIAVNLVGVILLFRYGMPFRVERRGASYFILEETDQDAIAAERRYKALGFVGLALIVVGSALQALAVLLA